MLTRLRRESRNARKNRYSAPRMWMSTKTGVNRAVSSIFFMLSTKICVETNHRVHQGVQFTGLRYEIAMNFPAALEQKRNAVANAAHGQYTRAAAGFRTLAACRGQPEAGMGDAGLANHDRPRPLRTLPALRRGADVRWLSQGQQDLPALRRATGGDARG
jgi:hypothetical protein